MKKFALFLLIFCLSANFIYSQNIDARNGWRLPTKGTFRIFVVFAEATEKPVDTKQMILKEERL